MMIVKSLNICIQNKNDKLIKIYVIFVNLITRNIDESYVNLKHQTLKKSLIQSFRYLNNNEIIFMRFNKFKKYIMKINSISH